MGQADSFYWLADANTMLLEIDTSLCRLLGYSCDDLRNAPLRKISDNLQEFPKKFPYSGFCSYLDSEGKPLLMQQTLFLREQSQTVFCAMHLIQEEEAQAAKNASLLQMILDAQPSSIVLLDSYMQVLWMNRTAMEYSGIDSTSLIGRACHEVWRKCRSGDCIKCPVEQCLAEGRMVQQKMNMAEGQRWRVTCIPVFNDLGGPGYALFVGDDITEYLTLAAEARQNHKLESLGTLAGGIAHDFNNILSGILGYTELSLAMVSDEGPLKENLRELVLAGKRATELVRQILTFSRRGESKLVPTHVPIIVKEVLKLLRSTLPTTIEIKRSIDSDVEPVLADPVQIHQIIMNLCTNASHAMEPGGGILTVTIRTVQAPGADVPPRAELMPGKYLLLEVSDTGSGINRDILESICDPYFTTKPQGQGTGLGLSVVHGIVKDCGGYIRVDSELGQGSAFSVYLPTVEYGVAEDAILSNAGLLRGKETIMVVDDEPMVLKVSGDFLQLYGYRVIAEHNSRTALERFQEDPGAIDLLISDVTMPNLTGDRLAREFLAIRPDLPIILVTGYSDHVSEQSVRTEGVASLLMKPMVGKSFLTHVRRLLDSRKQ